jgi:hypothetical protein
MNSEIYLTLEEYNDFVSQAHAQYMMSRLHRTPSDTYKKHHPSDLAIETASFFEASYLVLDSYLDIVTARLRAEREKKEQALEPPITTYSKSKKRRASETPTK